ncbi:hypothetical protein F5Y05DRAFT_379551 [Hypoxylon sp. FL0543]|nr:hypothetical protein F5Y05DRAFT_379551 [Hypoxylon sp. FL0543]
MENNSGQSLRYGDDPEKPRHRLSALPDSANSYPIDQFIIEKGDAPVGSTLPSDYRQEAYDSLEYFDSNFNKHDNGRVPIGAGRSGTDENKRGKGKTKQPKAASSSRPKDKYLACPFCKHDVGRYLSKDACSRYSWPTVSRLKTDHIFKHHILTGVQCQKCGTITGTDSGHACTPKDFEPREGVTHEMIGKLRNKGTARSQSEEEKWHAVYSILFPDIDRKDHPSPYLEAFPGFRPVDAATFGRGIRSIVSEKLRATELAGDAAESLIKDIADSVHIYFAGFPPIFTLAAPRVTPTLQRAQASDNPPSDDHSQDINSFQPEHTFNQSNASTSFTGGRFAQQPIDHTAGHPYVQHPVPPMLSPSLFYPEPYIQHPMPPVLSPSSSRPEPYIQHPNSFSGAASSFPNYTHLANAPPPFPETSHPSQTQLGGFNASPNLSPQFDWHGGRFQ